MEFSSASLLLRLIVVASCLFAMGGLALSVVLVKRRGNPKKLSHPAGSTRAGINYALGEGMLPWAKESVKHHLPTYFAGILYHSGVAAASLILIAAMFQLRLSEGVLNGLRVFLGIGLICGIGLLFKRVFIPHMRYISVPDDFLANLMVNTLLLSAFGATFGGYPVPLFLVIVIVVALYVPFGKIRHCAFFFYSRVLFGRFFGRRGVLPHH